MRSEKTDRILSIAVILVIVSQILLFLVSWLITAASPETNARSLLGSEGLRWFFGRFVDNVATPPLVWIIILAMAYGALHESKIMDMLHKKRDLWTYRQSFAFKIVIAELIAFFALVAVLAFVPHAELLSATGMLFPSPFSNSLVPIIGVSFAVASISFGLLVGSFRSVADVVDALLKGICKAAPLILLYVICAELFFSIDYVFGLGMV